MTTPLPLFHRLAVMFGNLNKQPRVITLRGASAPIANAGATPHTGSHAQARARQPSPKIVRTWRQSAAQTPSNLM